MNNVGGIDPKQLKAYESPVGPAGERQNSQEQQEKPTRSNRTRAKKDKIQLSKGAQHGLEELDAQFSALVEAYPDEQHLFGIDGEEQARFNPHGRRLLANTFLKARAKRDPTLQALLEEVEALNTQYQEGMEALREEQLKNQAGYHVTNL